MVILFFRMLNCNFFLNMKVFLCRGKRLSFIFPKTVSWERKDAAVWLKRRKGEVDLQITKYDVTYCLGEDNVTRNNWRKQMNNVWGTKSHPNKLLNLVHQMAGDLTYLYVRLDHVPGGEHPFIRYDQLRFHVQGKLLQDIRIALGVQDVRLQMELFEARFQSKKAIMQLPNASKRFEPVLNIDSELQKHVKEDVSENYRNPFDTSWIKCTMDMPLKSDPNDFNLAYCEERISLPESWRLNWLNFNDDNKECDNDVEFSVKTNLLISVVQPEIYVNTKFYIENEFEMDDVNIISSNEKITKCKGSCVKQQSKLLKTIIEENGNKLEMTNMSEQVVRAFVAYVSNQDLSEPLQVFSVAVDLFQIAQRYSIRHMEIEMKNVLLGKPYLWFDDVNSALELLLFVVKFPEHSDLKWKTLHALKSMPGDVLITSRIYKQLFKENQQTSSKLDDAKQLCDALLSLPIVDVMSLSKL